MELSKKERLFLKNQYQILAALYPEEKDDFEVLIEILSDGYENEYYEIYEVIFDPMPKSKGALVIKILSFYRYIDSNSSPKISAHRYAYFHGFDGNSETDYMTYARFLIEKKKYFSEQEKYFKQNDTMNSHHPMVDIYQRILEKWEKHPDKHNLTEDQILEILDA